MAKSFQNAGSSLSVFIRQLAKDMEDLTSAMLCTLLGIPAQTSGVLGCGPASFSLQQKVLLIREIREMDKIVGQKMMRLVQIINLVSRSNIESVDELFTGTGILGKDIYRDIDQWYFEGRAMVMSVQERDRKIQPVLLSMLMEIKKAILDCMKNEFVEERRRESFHKYNDFFVESVLAQLKFAKLDLIGVVAETDAQKKVNKHLDEIAETLKNVRSNKKNNYNL